MKTLLIVTTGISDVQLWTETERLSLDRFCCGIVHDMLLACRERWGFADKAVIRGRGKTIGVDDLPKGDFKLCTPRLDAVLRYVEGWHPQGQGTQMEVTDALLLGTKRQDDGDPRRAVDLLTRRLEELVPSWAGAGGGRIHPGIYLEEGRVEARSQGDVIVRRDVVERISGFIRHAMDTAQPECVVLLSSSGIKQLDPIVEELTLLFAPAKCEVHRLVVPEPKPAKRKDCKSKEEWSQVDHPPKKGPREAAEVGATEERAIRKEGGASIEEIYRARRRAIHLLSQGQPVGAWGAVRHLADQEGERGWVEVIEWAYLWATSQPVPTTCDIEEFLEPKRSLRAGLLLEMALRAKDIPRAIHLTVSFFESAIWDHLESRFVWNADQPRRIGAEVPMSPKLVIVPGGTKEPLPKDNTARPFLFIGLNDGLHVYEVRDGSAQAGKLVKHALKDPSLQALSTQISKSPDVPRDRPVALQGKGVRDLRNDVAHSIPSEEFIASASAMMASWGLWSGAPSIVGQALVEDVFESLNGSSIGARLDGLVDRLAQRLKDHPILPTPK